MAPPSPERWVLALPDQLTTQVGPLAGGEPHETGLILIENLGWARSRPHHKQKLALVFASQRHFAAEQRNLGRPVRLVVTDTGYRSVIEALAVELDSPIRSMRPAERIVREELWPLLGSGLLEWVENGSWLTTTDDFTRSQRSGTFRMDRFYRQVRRRLGILMHNGKPVGGKYSFDAHNRRRWNGDPKAPAPPTFPVDPIKLEVAKLVESAFGGNPGRLDIERLPASAADADALWAWALEHCIPHFGPFEDAMSERSQTLFHTTISPLLNNGRLLPHDVINDVLSSGADLPSVEGFVRQVLGWREFVRHVHEASDGFSGADDVLGRENDLPSAFWGSRSGLRCLDQVVETVLETGWSHHITRLMVLCNLATLLDTDPRQVSDWFWDMYVDAWDWVVEPNVLGMGMFALGDAMTTKPYVSGAAYISKMSDFCRQCAFDPKTDCPVTNLYWDFLDRHRPRLEGNVRMRLPLNSSAQRPEHRKHHDRAVFEWAVATLAEGQPLLPENLPPMDNATKAHPV